LAKVKNVYETELVQESSPAPPLAHRQLEDELKNYHYDDNGKPAKGDDDAVDMCLYAMKPCITPVDRTRPILRSGH